MFGQSDVILVHFLRAPVTSTVLLLFVGGRHQLDLRILDHVVGYRSVACSYINACHQGRIQDFGKGG